MLVPLVSSGFPRGSWTQEGDQELSSCEFPAALLVAKESGDFSRGALNSHSSLAAPEKPHTISCSVNTPSGSQMGADGIQLPASPIGPCPLTLP